MTNKKVSESDGLGQRVGWLDHSRGLFVRKSGSKGDSFFLITGDKIAIRPMACKVSLFEPLPDGRLPTLREFERQYVQKVLAHVNDNKSKAAKMLGIDRASLWRKLKKYNLKILPSDQSKGGCNEAKMEEQT